MGAVVAAIIGWWLLGVILSWFYFWLKKTDRSMAPIERRFVSLGHAVIWPYHLYKAFSGKAERAHEQAELEAQRQRIINGSGAAPNQSPAPPAGSSEGSGSSIRNPFDNL